VLAQLLTAATWVFLLGTPVPRAPAQASAIQYSAGQLNCTRFRETSQSTILTQAGGRDREQTSGRKGVWRFRANADGGALALEGWLESLTVWRRSPEAMLRPDTDGLIGGRYRGTLSQAGTYSSRARPFVPDEVAEVAGMATALDDFFPPLPPRPLHVGEVWTDSAGITIQRMADSALSGLPLYRFELQLRRESRSAEVGRDSVPLELHQVTHERGVFVWHPSAGLMRRERRITVETTVPAGGTVRQAIRSRIHQRISIVRDLTVQSRDGGACPELSPQTRAGSPPT
jgi:hypothetical protein